jgi:adenosylcobinamide kinase/adenosylcobinamide-phosphate guanylyltransferase
LFFYLGGAKSGKTKTALEKVESWPGPYVYLATAKARDEEMRAKVKAHQAERGPKWRTVEAPDDPAGAILELKGPEPILLDCLTLWLGNLLESIAEPYSLAAVEEKFAAILKAIVGRKGPTVAVSGEVGSGLVPMEPLSRFYREGLGRINQLAAKEAFEAYLVVAGIPLKLK